MYNYSVTGVFNRCIACWFVVSAEAPSSRGRARELFATARKTRRVSLVGSK